MREIKFRAWYKHCWEYVMDYNPTLHVGSGYSVYINEAIVEEKEKIIMQYTGLKDKNRKEIYEGDIVHKGGILGTIVWTNEYQALGFYLKSEDALYDVVAPYYTWDLEVVGNVYENPDLIA